MKRFIKYTVSLAAAALLLSLGACNDLEPWPAPLSERGISREVSLDFFTRNGGNVSILEAKHYQDDGRDEIVFRGPDGVIGHSEYLDGAWQMTIRTLNPDRLAAQLPMAVSRAFARLDLGTPCFVKSIDRIAEITRTGIAHTMYDFMFATDLTGAGNHFLTHYVLINEDGTVLANDNAFSNPAEWFRDFDTALGYIRDRYADCDVRGHANRSGIDTFYILHDGKMKQVRFHNNFQVNYPDIREAWEETEYELDPAEVPAEVRDLCRNWRESDLEADPFYEKYFFLEDWQGTYYGYQISEPSRKSLITRYTPAGE